MNKYIIIILLLALSTEARTASNFSGDRLRQGCLEFIYDNLGEDAQVAVAGNIQDQSFEEENVFASFVANPKMLRGSAFVQIEFRKDDQLLRRVQIPVRIKIYRDVPVAAENIARESELTENEITYQKLNVTYYSDDDFPGTEEIIGTKADRNISKGTVITKKLLRDESGIRKGEKVSVILESGTIQIRTYGTALQDAGVGSEIRVKRENSNSVLQGRVTKEGTVIISSL
jgi:flagella basal body P-ring formation protein FlgA